VVSYQNLLVKHVNHRRVRWDVCHYMIYDMIIWPIQPDRRRPGDDSQWNLLLLSAIKLFRADRRGSVSEVCPHCRRSVRLFFFLHRKAILRLFWTTTRERNDKKTTNSRRQNCFLWWYKAGTFKMAVTSLRVQWYYALNLWNKRFIIQRFSLPESTLCCLLCYARSCERFQMDQK